ncbi:MAG: hypothetical protein LQ350_000860 [Teloschistes chrysophthalmus]|nr:MAG: hypothetical protein LQ350_000860 [Niorma chrysophthalma]
MSTNPITYPTTTMDAANEPIQLHIPPSLTAFTVNVPTFLANNPRYNRLACSAFIFATPPSSPSTTLQQEPHLLLIHRSAHDSHFPSFWETPGGTAETTDPTVLHSLAREVYEETGLRVTRFLAQVGNGSDFLHCEPGDSMVYYGLKLSFVVEVAEVDENGGNGGEGKGLEGIPVRLDPEEHQGFVWAREEEVREGFMEVGKEIVPGDLRDRMMVAFGIVKAPKNE